VAVAVVLVLAVVLARTCLCRESAPLPPQARLPPSGMAAVATQRVLHTVLVLVLVLVLVQGRALGAVVVLAVVLCVPGPV
jgi:hypothetical protein